VPGARRHGFAGGGADRPVALNMNIFSTLGQANGFIAGG
jgi:hypothetical protein